MGYHRKKIEKGVLGTPSKIREEFEEFEDALSQDNKLMALLELSDLLGAINAYAGQYNMTIDHLWSMTRATQSAFKDGERVEKPQQWKCRRCKTIVDMVAFRCNCKQSPSPWEPI